MSKYQNIKHTKPTANCQLSILLSFLIALLLAGCTTPAVTSRDTNPQTNLHALWQILDERYCFFNERNINWDGVLSEYEPCAAKATTVFALYNTMSNMLDTLNDGHVNLYTPFAVSSCTGWYDAYPTDYYSDIVFSDSYVRKHNYINSLSYGLIGQVGYIYLSTFSTSISPTTMQYIDYYFRNCKGIILDVRSNGGGSLDLSSSLAACFFAERTHTGYMRHKEGKAHDDFSEPQPTYTDPAKQLIDWSNKRVVVLCNRRSYSATNDFVNRVRYAPNVTIVGGITGGGGGMPLSQELPNGWMIRFSAIPMYDASMNTIEFGIEPDIEVHISSEERAAGVDAILDKALEIIGTI